MPVLERYLAVLVAAGAAEARDRPRRGHVRPLRGRLRVRGEHARCRRWATSGAGQDQLAAYFRSLPPDEFPSLVALADDLTAGDNDERFEFALDLLCAGSRRWPGAPRLAGEPLLGQLAPRVLGLLEAVEAHPAQHRLGLGELDLAVLDDLDVVAPRVAELEAAARAAARCPASSSAARTASRSSTTSPKWRPPSGPWRRPRRRARNWSPMSRNAIPRTRPRSSKPNSRP